MSEERNILNTIRTICTNGESGRLEILAGAVQGELSFANGKLVDARFGHLTGFRAVNAVAAMRDARFSFDPAFTPLASSSITASERVVLKQFFGIETAATSEYLPPVVADWPEEAAPATVADAPEEVTIVRSDVKSDEIPVTTGEIPVRTDEIPAPLPPHVTGAEIPITPPSYASRSYRIALALAVLAMAVLAAAAVFINRFNDSLASTVVAGVESPSRPAPAQSESPMVQSAPINSVPAPAAVKSVPAPAAVKSVPAPAAVKEDKKPLNTARGVRDARDLSGKWMVVNSVETTAYRSFKNMKIGFDLAINQTGTTFTGNGHKVSENGRTLPANSRTPIKVKGLIHGDRIEATFIEEGTARKSNGKFVWHIDKSGRGLTGDFATSAARSRGKSAATRQF
jgi:hypothetical protein